MVQASQYDNRDEEIEDPVLGHDRIKLHNAMVTIQKDVLPIDAEAIDNWNIVWEILDKPTHFITTSTRAIGSLSPVRSRINLCQFVFNNTKGFLFEPATETLYGPDSLGTLKIPNTSTDKLLSAQAFFDKYCPTKEEYTDKLRSPVEDSKGGNSKLAARKAKEKIEFTIRSNFVDAGAREAKEFAKEYAEELRKRGELTDDFVGSDTFYARVMSAYSG